MSILKDIDTTTIDYYGDKFDKIFVDFKIFIFLVLILVLVFVIRFFVLINIEKGKKKNKIEKSTILYILSHTTLELLFAFLISYILIKLTNANPESYIINYIAAPSVGVILAIYLDNKILMPTEYDNGIGSIIKRKKSKKEQQNSSSNNNTININIGDNDDDKSINISGDKDSKSEVLKESDIEEEDFELKVVNVVNNIMEEQLKQSDIITENTVKLENTIESLNILKESEMINKKIELKKLIYDCLNQEYATPEQNDRITSFYYAYRRLGGNHEVESLYNDHYIKLPVHEDRRVSNQNNIKIERRNQNKRKYGYGEFDNEDE